MGEIVTFSRIKKIEKKKRIERWALQSLLHRIVKIKWEAEGGIKQFRSLLGRKTGYT